MGLFQFSRKNRSQANSATDSRNDGHIHSADPAADLLNYGNPQGVVHANGEPKGIESIYAFLQFDYESKGYNDALTSPDESYKNDNVKLILLDLGILIQQVSTYYEDMLRELDFHIASRSRGGLIDLVDELKSKKEMVNEHMAKLETVKQDLESSSGMTRRILLSYQRGFMRGMAALTYSNVLNRKI